MGITQKPKVGHVYKNKAKKRFGMKYPSHDIMGICVASANEHERMFHREGVSHVPAGTKWGAFLEVQGKDNLYWVDSNDILVEVKDAI